MKLLHTADLHLSCSLAGFSKQAAREIKSGCIASLMDMCAYAKENQIKHILIAGDLFDTLLPSFDARNSVTAIFRDYREITFYLISGNHDKGFALGFKSNLPENVKLFSDGFSSYAIEENVVITSTEDTDFDFESLSLDGDKVNIVMLHAEPSSSSGEYSVKLSHLDGVACDYLALGHYHSYSCGKAGRGEWVMCGAPHARGFDETGDKGFVVIEINGAEVSHTFIKRNVRKFFNLRYDINGGDWYYFAQFENLLKENGVGKDDYVKITVTGKSISARADEAFVENAIVNKNLASFARVVDNTSLDTEEASAVSIYGEFCRLVEESEDISDADKAEILRYGYLALKGEEVDSV